MRRSHRWTGFSLIEVLVTLVLVGVLSLVAWTSFSGYLSHARGQSARSLLESVAGSQENYYLNRGQWASSASSLAGLSSSDVQVTSGNSTGAGVVSVSVVNQGGQSRLGLAVLDGNGNCLTLLLSPPESGVGQPVVQRRALTTCNGAMAAG